MRWGDVSSEKCPPEFDPRKSCIGCDVCFDDFEELKEHMKKEHPELLSHWKMILESWDVEC